MDRINTHGDRRNWVWGLSAFVLIAATASCTDKPDGGGDSVTTGAVAATNTDQISWQQFLIAVAPSSISGKVTYETWASDQDIYVSPCTGPNTPAGCGVPTWPTGTSLANSKSLAPSALGVALKHGAAKPAAGVEVIGPAQGCAVPTSIQPNGAAADSGFPATGCVGEEVRRDRASFDYLVKNGLWSKAGLAKYFSGSGTVTFPDQSLQVKADWIPVSTMATWLGKPESFVTQNFYTANAVAQTGGPSIAYAMTSMHVSLKSAAFPNWVWANFENAYTPGRCDVTGCSDSYGANTPNVPAAAKNWGQYGACAKPAALLNQMTKMKVAAVFGNYCLTGSQTAYGTASNPTLLGSPIIEPLNAGVPLANSSCISCHVGASFKSDGTPNTPTGPIGPAQPPANSKTYDFMWGLLGIFAEK